MRSGPRSGCSPRILRACLAREKSREADRVSMPSVRETMGADIASIKSNGTDIREHDRQCAVVVLPSTVAALWTDDACLAPL